MSDKLTIEKIPHQVPPVQCVYSDMEEATYRLEVDANHRYTICNNHMREYLLEVLEKL